LLKKEKWWKKFPKISTLPLRVISSQPKINDLSRLILRQMRFLDGGFKSGEGF